MTRQEKGDILIQVTA